MTATVEEIRGVAEVLHKVQCRWNHTDGCGWMYEYERFVGPSRFPEIKENVTQPVLDERGKTIPNWNGLAHREYFNKAKKVIDNLDPDVPPGVIVMVLEALT